MKPAIFFTTETQRAQSNDPSTPATALASPACGWSRVDKANLRVVGLSMLQLFRLFFVCSVPVLRSLGVAGCFVVSILALTVALRAQTNTFPASGNVGIGTTSPGMPLEVSAPSGTTPFYVHGASSNAYFGLSAGQYLFLDSSGVSPATAANPTQNSPMLALQGTYWNGSGSAAAASSIWTVVTSSNQNYMGFRTSNADRMVLNQSGYLGIGTTTPRTSLDVNGIICTNTSVTLEQGAPVNFDLYANTQIYSPASNVLAFSTNHAERVRINSVGNVGIGTTSPGYPLTVNGAVRAKEVIVDTGWSDYVFEKSYRLAPLSEVEQRIKEDHHLPGIPSAQEVNEKGISVGQMQAKFLAKMEEMTLYMIEQEKRMNGFQQRVQQLETENATLRSVNREP